MCLPAAIECRRAIRAEQAAARSHPAVHRDRPAGAAARHGRSAVPNRTRTAHQWLILVHATARPSRLGCLKAPCAHSLRTLCPACACPALAARLPENALRSRRAHALPPPPPRLPGLPLQCMGYTSQPSWSRTAGRTRSETRSSSSRSAWSSSHGPSSLWLRECWASGGALWALSRKIAFYFLCQKVADAPYLLQAASPSLYMRGAANWGAPLAAVAPVPHCPPRRIGLLIVFNLYPDVTELGDWQVFCQITGVENGAQLFSNSLVPPATASVQRYNSRRAAVMLSLLFCRIEPPLLTRSPACFCAGRTAAAALPPCCAATSRWRSAPMAGGRPLKT